MIKTFSWILLVLSLANCAPKSSSEEATLASISDPEIMKYAIPGKILYENHCSNCHQSDGTGLGKLIPPLKGADYFEENIQRTVLIIRHGQKGEITVNGQLYNQAMPGNQNLRPLEIAQITTYLYNIWGNNAGIISSSEVEKILQKPLHGN
jgi:mono/diheme cytochrome c family protein